jgi:hypothetical protein
MAFGLGHRSGSMPGSQLPAPVPGPTGNIVGASENFLSLNLQMPAFRSSRGITNPRSQVSNTHANVRNGMPLSRGKLTDCKS